MWHFLDYPSNKMKVVFAVQTLSRSCANALLFCENQLKLAEFNGSQATSEFLFKFNEIFDLLNSNDKFGRFTQSPINQETFNYFCEKFESLAIYICELKHIDGSSVITGKRKQAFLGWLSLCKSFIYIYRCYIQTHHMEYILTYKYSQDHLEHFFGQIRGSLGYNNNPTTKQVKCYFLIFSP